MLYTVTATFSDFTNAVEQYEGATPDEALIRFVESSESMREYDLTEWSSNRSGRLSLLHIGGGLRGAWIWTPLVPFEHDDIGMLGGVIVQTDPTGPVRGAAA